MSRVKAVGPTPPSALTTKGDGGGGQNTGGEPDPQPRQKTAGKKKTGGRGFVGRDTLERSSQASAPRPSAGLSAGLTVQGEDQLLPEQQLATLQEKLAEAESAFRFMGTGHPSYERTRAQVEQLRAMVNALTG